MADAPQPGPPPGAAPPGEARARALALAVCAAVVALVLARALGAGGEHYDAYEARAAGRALLAGDGAGVPVYRSPLLVLVAALGEALGRRAAWLLPSLAGAAGHAALVAGVVALAARLGARPWLAATAGLIAALDRVAWLHAPHGLSDLPGAAGCAWVLALAAGRPGEERWLARPLLVGALVGLTALARHNAALVGLALAAGLAGAGRPGERRLRPLAALALAGGLAVGLYLVVTTCTWAAARGSLAGGLAAHAELAAFQREQLHENLVRYGRLQAPFTSVRFLLVAAPALLLAPWGLALALRGELASPAARACAAWAALHLLFVTQVAGHLEARYLLPAAPALAALAVLPLEALARAGRLRGAAPLAVVAGLAAVTLALAAPWEARHALDPVTRGSFAAEVARAVEARLGPGGRVVWTARHPYPAAPAVVLDPGTPFGGTRAHPMGDPFHGIWHLGPVGLGWELRRPVLLAGPSPQRPEGLRAPADLRAFVRGAVLPDGRPLGPGDVLVVGTTEPATTAALAAARTWPPLGVLRVVAGPDVDEGLWLEPGRP